MRARRNRVARNGGLEGRARLHEIVVRYAVHLLDGFLKGAKPPAGAKITFAPGQGHGWRGISEKELMKQMGDAVEAARPKP